MSEEMPRNMIAGAQEEAPTRDDAAIEAEWLANNVPHERLELHWRYANGSVQLYERRLRSLPAHGVGPALCSYLRTRLEWLCDNKLRAQPNGMAVVTVETNGDVDIQLADAVALPQLGEANLIWDDDTLTGADVSGALFVRTSDELVIVSEEPLRDACETFAQDLSVTLAKSLGYSIAERDVQRNELASAEIALVNDELGLVVLDGHAGAYTQKLTACFDKLWSK